MSKNIAAHAGFTGTRKGMTEKQLIAVKYLLRTFKPTTTPWFHHGCCLGADQQAHDIAKALGIKICAHPPKNKSLAFKADADHTMPEEDYLPRNRRIVNLCGGLIAAPLSDKETQKSGTWYTIRFAKRQGKPIIIIYPDGSYWTRLPDGTIEEGKPK